MITVKITEIKTGNSVRVYTHGMPVNDCAANFLVTGCIRPPLLTDLGNGVTRITEPEPMTMFGYDELDHDGFIHYKVEQVNK